MTLRLSILDLASVGPGETIADGLNGCVNLAQLAESMGYHRLWYAEHHSIESIASAATAVLIAHVGAHTKKIRLGAGGVMLPNHSPLTIAEQFGTLAELHPGRIDLGLGRAPGGDARTFAALRRDPSASDRFPQDVIELRGLLGTESPLQGVTAIPGYGTRVPLYILGSSLFGAQLAASLGLPYAFASHFAPAALQHAIALYREQFTPSTELAQPYVIAGINVIAAESDEEARAHLETTRRIIIKNLSRRGSDSLENVSDAELLSSSQAAFVQQMLSCRAVGRPDAVVTALQKFRRECGADELMTVHHCPSVQTRLLSVELLANAAKNARS